MSPSILILRVIEHKIAPRVRIKMPFAYAKRRGFITA